MGRRRKPLTFPLGRWQALRAASTRLRSAGNIWKKLKEQRKKAPGKHRVRPGEGRLWGAGSKCGEEVGVTHFFTGIFPSGFSCILSFTRLVGQKAACQALGLGDIAPQAKARQAGTYILSRKVLREALAVSGCLTRASTSSAQSCRTPEHSSQAPDLKDACTTPWPRPVSREVQAVPGAKPQARYPHTPCPHSPCRRQSCGR